jgi:hypothetical protein
LKGYSRTSIFLITLFLQLVSKALELKLCFDFGKNMIVANPGVLIQTIDFDRSFLLDIGLDLDNGNDLDRPFLATYCKRIRKLTLILDSHVHLKFGMIFILAWMFDPKINSYWSSS